MLWRQRLIDERENAAVEEDPEGTLEKRQSALEREVADLRRAIQDSRMSAFEHHNGAGPSTKPVTVPEQQSYHGHIHAIFYERQHLPSHQLED
ncbi:hypothetical protein LWI28_022542 [Acer negundo]|uniref:Uncharacterized protein n=1 Tax=Acer negundo TaxID=4023 RepID=A0AAD5ISM9_ACENE|nr:hypothetical protein LWI28_022542 [Acer negundo]